MLLHKALSETYTNSLEATLHEKSFHDSLHTLGSSLGSCERIVKQPVPIAYSRHGSRFLSLYMLTLPLSLCQLIGWATVPVISALHWSFVSIQEIGHFIEEPFNKKTQIIPLQQISSVIRIDVSGTIVHIILSNLCALITVLLL
jgi:predicted membrane chloride channel (bestrophin family)